MLQLHYADTRVWESWGCISSSGILFLGLVYWYLSCNLYKGRFVFKCTCEIDVFSVSVFVWVDFFELLLLVVVVHSDLSHAGKSCIESLSGVLFLAGGNSGCEIAFVFFLSGLIFFASFRYCEPLNICLKGKKVLLVFFFNFGREKRF